MIASAPPPETGRRRSSSGAFPDGARRDDTGGDALLRGATPAAQARTAAIRWQRALFRVTLPGHSPGRVTLLGSPLSWAAHSPGRVTLLGCASGAFALGARAGLV